MDTLRLGQQNTMLDMVRQLRQMDQVLDRISSADVPNYEEGTFNPTIRGTGTAGTGTYTVGARSGRYTCVGRLVYIELYMVWTNLTGATGTLAVGNLPFTAANSNTFPSLAIGWANNIALTANNVLTAYVNSNSATIVLYQYPTGGGAATTVPIDTAGGIQIAGVYSI